MNQQRKTLVGVGLVGLIGALWLGQGVVQSTAQAGRRIDVPMFEVDPFWPKPLPNSWRIGSTIGLTVDNEDNIWIIHRPATLSAGELNMQRDPPTSTVCCQAAPPVLVFDQDGNLVRSWGGPGEGYDWPESNHGISVDHMGYVWIGGNGQGDSHILKFTKDGRFVAQYGKPGARVGPAGPTGQPTYVANSHDQVNFGRVTKIIVDPVTNEAFVGDGYLNRRVAVLDATTGEMKRYWGAYGNRPDDNYAFRAPGTDDVQPPQQFRGPVHCAVPSNDGLIYVCDRGGNRIQVFQRDGTYVKEAFFAATTTGSGTTWDVAFSPDPDQRFVYVPDGMNDRVRIVLRETLEELTSFGAGGRQVGQFYGVHNVAVDSRGNLYTTETYEGKRLQKFVNVGMGTAPSGEQGVLWPER